MYKSYLLLSLIICVIIIITSCGDDIIGSESNQTIDEIVQDSEIVYTFTNNQLKASGMIKNIGNTLILAPWYIETEFFSDSTFSLILGGDQYSFHTNLDTSTSTIWTLEFSSDEIVESNYPDFAIKNFRAFRKK